MKSLFNWVPDENRRVSLLIKDLKACENPDQMTPLARRLLARWPIQNGGEDLLIVPIPSRSGRRDHADSLAMAISNFSGIPVARLLKHQSPEIQQKRLSKGQRRGIRFELCEKISKKTKVILVDDVLTTGSTLSGAIRAVGPRQIKDCFVIADRAPLAAKSSLLL